MILALLALGLLLLALPGLHRGPPQHLPLHEWVPLATASLVTGLIAVELGLVFIALPTVAHAVGVAAIADACHDVLAPLSTAPSAIGWLAALAATGIATLFAAGASRARAAARSVRAEPWLGRHEDRGDFELVVLPAADGIAFGVPGVPPQVMVAQGLVESLAPEALDAVVRHEAAHLRLNHPRLLVVLTGIEQALGVLPAAWRSTITVREALEDWADDAAGHDSREVRLALRRALVAVGNPNHHGTQRRVRRLARQPAMRSPARRVAAYAPVLLLVLTAMLLVLGWLTDAQHALAIGPACTS